MTWEQIHNTQIPKFIKGQTNEMAVIWCMYISTTDLKGLYICSLPGVMGNVICQLHRLRDCLGGKPLEKPVEHCLLDYG